MIHLPVPIISSTAGQNNDGVVVGSVAQSLSTSVLSNALIAPVMYVYRKDVSGSTFTFQDLSTDAADDDTANDFEPFGTNAQMSAGDELYVACDNPIRELYFDIDTPGVGTWGTIEIKYSNNGLTANATAAAVVDNTNAFKATDGIYRLTFTPPADITPFSPVPGNVATRNWLVIKPVSVTSVATSPKLNRIWIVHDTSAVQYINLTTAYNDALTNGTFTGSPATAFYPVETARLFGLPFLAYGMDHTIHRRLGGTTAVTPTVIAEYLASDDTWKPLPSYTTESAFFSTGPTTLGNPTEEKKERWEVPTDWIEKTLSLPLNTGGNGSFTGYFIRHRLTNMSSFAPIAPSLVRSRVRAFGNNNTTGIQLLSATTVKGLCIKGFGSQSAATTFQLLNMTTGQGRSFAVPSNPSVPLIEDFSDITFGAGERIGIAHVSGGTITSMDLYLLT